MRSHIASGETGGDGEAVRAVLQGEVERYAELVQRYRERYAGYATRLLGSADAAEDAMQDAFIRAYDQLGQCRDPENFSGWFFMILRNCCFAEARRQERRGHRPLADHDVNLAGPERTEAALEEAERYRRLREALARLTAEQREVFMLKHEAGLSYEEIARQTGVAVASLKMRMHRAYDRLRSELGGE